MNIVQKTFIKFFSLFIFLLVFPKVAFANDSFKINSFVTYEIEDTGNTNVKNEITIINSKSEVYAKQYVYQLNNIEPENIKITEGDSTLEYKINKTSEGVDIVIYFENPLTGKGTERNIIIQYSNPDLAIRTGEVWEITLPKIEKEDIFNDFNTTLVIPNDLGNEAYISPKPKDTKEEGQYKYYYFDKDQLLKSGISAGFGKFQVFSFNLNYHLENENDNGQLMEIAIPPDTSLQRVHYESIEPKPENVLSDDDGNWLVSYKIASGERLDVVVKGTVQIFSSPRNYLIPSPVSLLSNTKPTEYWQSNEDAIRNLADQLKTPRNIYDYVVKSLNYNFSGVKPDVQRLGAIDALRNPDKALCMEFTDLFVAITRAAGIPAREINGYAYTENPNIQPLSLVSDVLHSWPEYWDRERSTWVSIDPTWDNTSGVDFFDKLDLRHFAFVIHGKDSSKPYPPGTYKLGTNPQKDVYVTFGQLPANYYGNIKIISELSGKLNIFGKKYNIIVVNSGTTAEYNIEAQIIVDGQVKDRSFIQILPPFGKYEDSVSVSYGLFASRAPENILIQAGNSELSIPIDKNSIIINQLLAISSVLIFLVVILHPKRPSIRSIFGKIQFLNRQ